MLKSRSIFLLLILFILLISNVSCNANNSTPVNPTVSSSVPPGSNASASIQTSNPVSTTPSVPAIDVKEAYELIQNNQNNPDFIILDVRTPDEFKGGYIAGAINIDYYSSDFKNKISQMDRNKEYLVYCRSGVRGAASVQIMLDLGFTRVRNLSGGIVQWINAGLPTVH
jgi:rhodanese-related sulfurtransferase